MMDRTDMPSNEMQERIDEDTFDLVSRAVSARDAEWVQELNRLRWKANMEDVRITKQQATVVVSYMDELKARMTGDK